MPAFDRLPSIECRAMPPTLVLLAACLAAPAAAEQLRIVTSGTASGLGNNNTHGVFVSRSTVHATTLSGFSIGSPDSLSLIWTATNGTWSASANSWTTSSGGSTVFMAGGGAFLLRDRLLAFTLSEKRKNS